MILSLQSQEPVEEPALPAEPVAPMLGRFISENPVWLLCSGVLDLLGDFLGLGFEQYKTSSSLDMHSSLQLSVQIVVKTECFPESDLFL